MGSYLVLLDHGEFLVDLGVVVMLRAHADRCLDIFLSDQEFGISLSDHIVSLQTALSQAGHFELSSQKLDIGMGTSFCYLFFDWRRYMWSSS